MVFMSNEFSGASERRPFRGEIVQYEGELFFFQPNGTFCYLYEHPHDIGIVARAKHTPRVSSIYRLKQNSAPVLVFRALLPAESRSSTRGKN
jgi:hypothetical protein